MYCLKNAHSLRNGFICFWRIEDFIICKPNKNLVFHSERFKIDMIHCSEWHLEIQQNSSRILSVYLFKDEACSIKYSSIYYSISLLTDSGWKVLTKDKSIVFKSGGAGFGVSNFINWHNITIENLKYLPNRALTISCRIWNTCMGDETVFCLMSSRLINEKRIFHLSFQISSKLDSEDFKKMCASRSTQTDKTCEMLDGTGFISTNTQTTVAEKVNMFSNPDDFLFLFKEKGFEYVVLRTSEKEYFAHKALLCARSHVFETMFNIDMEKNINNDVDIEDIENDTLESMLKFIHSEPLGELKWEETVKLFYAANKYQIEQLTNYCVYILKIKLSEKTVCEVFVLADSFQNEDLRHVAQEYFCKNSKTILQTTEFQDLLFSRTELASEILSKLADRL